MKQELDRVLDEVRGAWRFRWMALSAAFAAAVIGWSVVFMLPDRYAADARVFVDTRTALKPALQGLTTDQNVDAQINYVRQSLLEGPQLERIARDTSDSKDAASAEGSDEAVLHAFEASRVRLGLGEGGKGKSCSEDESHVRQV